MAKVRELEEPLFRELAKGLEVWGFKPHRSSRSFVRKTIYGQESLHLAFIPHRQVDMDVVANVALRIDAVESLIEAHVGSKRGRDSATVGAELGNIAGTGQRRWTLVSERDAVAVARDIIVDFTSIGIPYIDEFSDARHLLEVLTQDRKAAILLMPLHDVRYRIAIALAHILKSPEPIHRVLARAEEVLPPTQLLELRDFASSLG